MDRTLVEIEFGRVEEGVVTMYLMMNHTISTGVKAGLTEAFCLVNTTHIYVTTYRTQKYFPNMV